MLGDLRARGQAITESARQPTPPPGAAMLEQSGRHQRLVSIEGAKAWATRRMAGSATEEVGFVRRKTAWYIRLFARRR